jgi:hypothetical protein
VTHVTALAAGKNHPAVDQVITSSFYCYCVAGFGELRRLTMNKSTDWPWSWEEEAEWKAEMEERHLEFLDELMDAVIEDDMIGARYNAAPTPQGNKTKPGAPEKYVITT